MARGYPLHHAELPEFTRQLTVVLQFYRSIELGRFN